MSAPAGQRLYALLAEFDTPEQLLEACESARGAGYQTLEAYTPYPIEEVSEALGHHTSKLPLIVLCGGVLGAVGGFALQFWSATMAYPLNVGGRPYNSWVAFIPVTFECLILVAAFSAVLGMFALNGLPKPHHPMFNVQRFLEASRDKYFLAISVRDPMFEVESARRFLEGTGARGVYEVDD